MLEKGQSILHSRQAKNMSTQVFLQLFRLFQHDLEREWSERPPIELGKLREGLYPR